jgi:hypothetical protein
MLWWGPVMIHARGVLPFMLFIGTPGIAAAAAGTILGKALLDPARVRGPGRAALWGAAIGSLALLLFAPLFATFYVLTEPPNENWNVFGLALMVLMGSAIAVWWLVAAISAAVGWALYRVASHGAGKAAGERGRH